MQDADPIEALFARGVTDGLPVVPPTPARVAAAVAATGRRADEVVAEMPPGFGRATVQKIAINAVMAGCRPEYLPVVLAAVDAICDERFCLLGVSGTTDAVAPLVIVNGPIRAALDINSGAGVFGPGWRANATIGRAVRLVMRNVIGTIPGKLDRGTICHPGKYSYVIAENEVESPWTPLHVERIGCNPDDSAVTVMAALSPHQVYNQLSNTAAGVLGTFCDTMKNPGQIGQPNYCLVVGGEHMRTIAGDKWTKADIRQFVFDHTKTSVAHLRRTAKMPGALAPEDETTRRPLVSRPEDLLVIAAGGRAGSFSAYIPGWGARTTSEAVTKLIR